MSGGSEKPQSDIGPPFHEGELAVQARVGVRDQMAKVGRHVFRDYLPEQHRAFFAQLPFIVVAATDADGQAWATALAHPPGFIDSTDPHRLIIQALPNATDPLLKLLQVGAPVGLLGIDFAARRRNRLNGVIDSLPMGGFSVQVQQSFGNCPKYIQARQPVYLADVTEHALHQSTRLDEAAGRLIARSDTFFVASAHPVAQAVGARARGVDVSHRGGKPGFVRIDDDASLTVPDFLGNYFFNTLGNIALNPRVGLVFMDFVHGDLLHIAADAKIVWDGPDLASYDGAERLLRLHIRQVRRVEGGLALRWHDAPSLLSPHLNGTGAWPR